MQKPTLNFWQIWNMSFGFLGIQFGWGLQMANMSSIYEYLGATPDQIPMLWLAAPLTGLIVQPIIGSMSDRTWGPLGRRRPYFLAGAILSSLALCLMPSCSSLWMAAGLLWILDASINVSMEPFRAFVADMLPEAQRARGFAMQSVFIGLGAVIASSLPWIFTNVFGITGHGSGGGSIPSTVRYSFYLGALAFIGAVLWTIFTTREYPPEDLAAFRAQKAQRRGIAEGVEEILDAIKHMPSMMRKLAWVQVCTWLGLFCMWLYFVPAVARDVFGAPDEKSPLYHAGTDWGGVCFAVENAVAFFAAFGLVAASKRVSPKTIHTVCLVCGGLGLLSVGIIHDRYLLLVSMAGVGIAWASILSMPYALLAGSLPAARMGVYMGIFNFFIVLPEIIASLGFGWVMNHWLHNNRLMAVVTGGVFMLLASVLMQRVREETLAVQPDDGAREPAPVAAIKTPEKFKESTFAMATPSDNPENTPGAPPFQDEPKRANSSPDWMEKLTAAMVENLNRAALESVAGQPEQSPPDSKNSASPDLIFQPYAKWLSITPKMPRRAAAS